MRVALLGFGTAGEFFHAPLIAATPGLELAVVITGNAERSARAAARYPGALISHDPEAAWAADAVVVATPNRSHAAYAHDAIARGIAVIVDKPLAITLPEIDVLLDDAAAHRAKLTVFQNRRWDGDFLTLRKLVAAGTLGAPIRFTSRFERFRPVIKDGWREAGDPRDGGGTLLDLGAHLIDQALVLLGPARNVYAELDRRRPGAATDDDAFVVIEHRSGARSHLGMSAISPVPATRMAFAGTAGGFSSAELDVQEGQLRAGRSPTDPAFGANPPGLLHDAEGSHEHPVERGDYLAFYAGVPAWLAGEAPAPVEPAESRAAFAVIEAARRSATARAVVELTAGR